MIIERACAHVASYEEAEWPWSVPCVRGLLADGLVDHWRRYLADPQSCPRHILG